MTEPEPTAEFVENDLSGARFHQVRLNGARFRQVDLAGAVLREVSVAHASIDGEIAGLLVNGVEVAPLVEAELVRRVPARALLNASTPDQLRAAWSSLQRSWAETYERVDRMAPGVADRSVENEWSFTETLRHLVFVTDAWLGAARGSAEPFHAWGIPFTDIAAFVERPDLLGTDSASSPTYAEVRGLRAERVAAVTDFLIMTTPEQLAKECPGPEWAGAEPLTVLRCLRVLLHEECEHLRYVQRDLDWLAANSAPPGGLRTG